MNALNIAVWQEKVKIKAEIWQLSDDKKHVGKTEVEYESSESIGRKVYIVALIITLIFLRR